MINNTDDLKKRLYATINKLKEAYILQAQIVKTQETLIKDLELEVKTLKSIKKAQADAIYTLHNIIEKDAMDKVKERLTDSGIKRKDGDLWI